MQNFLKKYYNVFILVFFIISAITSGIGFYINNIDMAVNSVASMGVIVLLQILVYLLKRFFKIHVEYSLNLTLNFFIFLSVYLGSSLGFYSINHWDTFLHVASGLLTFVLGYSLFLTLNNFQLSNTDKRVIICFALFFAIASTSLWEIWEFAGDTLLGGDAQKGLVDTMKDIITGCIIPILMVPYLNKYLNTGKSLLFNNLINPFKSNKVSQ